MLAENKNFLESKANTLLFRATSTRLSKGRLTVTFCCTKTAKSRILKLRRARRRMLGFRLVCLRRWIRGLRIRMVMSRRVRQMWGLGRFSICRGRNVRSESTSLEHPFLRYSIECLKQVGCMELIHTTRARYIEIILSTPRARCDSAKE